jgi:hypothetical protein
MITGWASFSKGTPASVATTHLPSGEMQKIRHCNSEYASESVNLAHRSRGRNSGNPKWWRERLEDPNGSKAEARQRLEQEPPNALPRPTRAAFYG